MSNTTNFSDLFKKLIDARLRKNLTEVNEIKCKIY